MAANSYHFVTHWRVEATPAEVFAIIDAATDLPRWWPAVYLKVAEEEPGDANGIGKVVRLLTKGWLPYTLEWRFRSTDKVPPERLALVAFGDFIGRGVWTFTADGPFTNITYDWEIAAEKPLLKKLSFLLKPVFTANHLWAMKTGETSLKRELARRRAITDEERRRIPPPPEPTTIATPLLWLGGLSLLASLVVMGAVLILWPFFK